MVEKNGDYVRNPLKDLIKNSEFITDEKCNQLHVKLNSNSIDSIETFEFKSKSQTDRTLFIIGGIHGDEIQGVRASQALISLFKSTSQHTILQRLSERLNITIIPAINKIGYLAGLRFSPPENQTIEVLENGAIYVREKEVFDVRSFSMLVQRQTPDGWSDPNREWERNNTLVKKHLERIIKEAGDKLSDTKMLFLHDWADLDGMVNCFTDRDVDLFKKSEAVMKRFKVLDTRKTQKKPAKPVEYVYKYNQKEDFLLGWHLLKEKSIENFTQEAYAYDPVSARLHIANTLLIASVIAGLEVSDDSVAEYIKIAEGVEIA